MHGTIGRRNLDDNSPLGRLFACGKISEAEYQAGVRWRESSLGYLASIEAPSPYGRGTEDIPDDVCERYAQEYAIGRAILESEGKRVFHAVSAIVVYEEPEELGDFAFTSAAAKIGLAALALKF